VVPKISRPRAPAGSGVCDQNHDVEARVVSAAERDELWEVIAARAPHFDQWQARIGRSFPVAVLTHRPSPETREPA
jgi:hypothetical protein